MFKLKTRLFVLGISLLTSVASHGFLEKDFTDQAQQALIEDTAFYQTRFLSRGLDTRGQPVEIGYTKFMHGEGARGCLVISPGRTESSVKYLELASDLNKLGFSPIYAIDHRGQGFSSRYLKKKPQKGHITDFSLYVDDFKAFVDTVVLQDQKCSNKNDLYLLAHSMGGAIAAAYLTNEGVNSPFNKAILSSPMLKINLKGLPEAVILLTTAPCAFAESVFCEAYVVTKAEFENKIFEDEDNNLTRSLNRFNFNMHLFRTFSQTRLGAPTTKWVRESILADLNLRRPEVVKKLATPVRIYQAGDDTVVENSGQDEFYGYVDPELRSIKKFPGSQHEILMERDEVRNAAIEDMVEYFQK